MRKTVRTNKNIIGRLCVIRDIKQSPHTIVEGLIIDQFQGKGVSKRIRLQTGEHFGEVRMVGEYEFLEFCEPGEAPSLIASAWAEPMFA